MRMDDREESRVRLELQADCLAGVWAARSLKELIRSWSAMVSSRLFRRAVVAFLVLPGVVAFGVPLLSARALGAISA